MNILISTKTLALPSVSIYSIVNNDRGNPYFNKRMIWFPTNNFYWWLCQKIHHSKTSNKTKLTYNDEWFVILFCDIKADEDTEHNLLVVFFFSTHRRYIELAHHLSCSLHFSLSRRSSSVSVSLLHGAFEMSVNIDFIYLIDTAHTDTRTLHKQWCNGLETPHDQQQRGGE